jgi:hypothetical protein
MKNFPCMMLYHSSADVYDTEYVLDLAAIAYVDRAPRTALYKSPDHWICVEHLPEDHSLKAMLTSAAKFGGN